MKNSHYPLSTKKKKLFSGLNFNDKLITAAYLDVTDGMLIKY
jgi:hypothetical protein